MRAALTLLLAAGIGLSAAAQCNGDSALCARRYDQVCYLTTHNAFNYQGAFLFPNQTHPVSTQLQDGVRGLMLDVYMSGSQAVVYHGNALLGSDPLVDVLGDIRTFLDQNPNEVVTIIFECYITATQMEDAFTQAGLMTYLHSQSAGQPWPTLGDMIQSGQRLVVFTDANDTAGRTWYHHVWDHAVETHYSANSRADFSCAFNRGDSANALFILNHFITQSTIGTGIPDSADAINQSSYLLPRAQQCWTETGKFPNFLTVDFHEKGQCMAVVDALNAGLTATAPPEPDLRAACHPQPSTDFVILNLPAPASSFRLLDLSGREVAIPAHVMASAPGQYRLDWGSHSLQGLYILEAETPRGHVHTRLSMRPSR